MTKGIGTLDQLSDGQRNIVVAWTLLRQLTYPVSRHGVSVLDMKIILRLESMMDHYQDRRTFDLIFHEQFARLQPSNMKKDG